MWGVTPPLSRLLLPFVCIDVTLRFLQSFHEGDTTSTVYKYTVMPLVAYAFRRGGRGTCFAYGQVCCDFLSATRMLPAPLPLHGSLFA